MGRANLVPSAGAPSSMSVSLLAVVGLYLSLTLFAILIFVQFTYLSVLAVSLCFLSLFVIMSVAFYPGLLTQRFSVSWPGLAVSIIVLLYLLILAGTIPARWGTYVRVFPLLDTELGMGWHKDTAYHSSLIRSIMQFGCPSIAQHDVPPTAYHVLSHYVDALIASVTRIEVYDAYGLFFHFKVFTVLSALALFIARVTEKQSLTTFLFSVLLLAPLVLGSWHIVGSHGLWFTSILVICSARRIFNILTGTARLSNADYIFLFSLVVLVSLGKISSGFCYAVFSGLFLLVKNPKDVRTYFLGALWLLFFWLFQSLLRQDVSGGGLPSDLPSISLFSIYSFMIDSEAGYFLYLCIIELCIGLMAILCILERSRINKNALFASFLSLQVLVILFQISPFLSKPDVFYFCYGLSSILVLMVFQFSIGYMGRRSTASEVATVRNIRIVSVSGLILAAVAINYVYLSKNGLQFTHLRVNAASFASGSGRPMDLEGIDRPLLRFREQLEGYMASHDVSRRDALLYIPEQVFNSEIAGFGGHGWAQGLLIYAVSGVPLLHGIKPGISAYGFQDYSSGHSRIPLADFQPQRACFESPGKHIILVTGFSRPGFEIINCAAATTELVLDN